VDRARSGNGDGVPTGSVASSWLGFDEVVIYCTGVKNVWERCRRSKVLIEDRGRYGSVVKGRRCGVLIYKVMFMW
jgi:hypothetical protein